jgi:hypothetical protein
MREDISWYFIRNYSNSLNNKTSENKKGLLFFYRFDKNFNYGEFF